MTRQQLEWAAQHDWYCAKIEDHSGVVVWDHDADGAQITRRFTDFKQLRVWAGY